MFFFGPIPHLFSENTTKAIVGVNLDFSFVVNLKALKEGKINNFDASANINGSVSVGTSLDIVGGIQISGSDGTVKDQSSLDILGLDGVPINLGGCVPDGICMKGSSTIDPKAHNGFSSKIAYELGAGEGVDLSVDVFQVSDYIFYTKYGKGSTFHIPYLNDEWRDKNINKLIDNFHKLSDSLNKE